MTLRPIAKGEEILNWYGAMGNAQLLQRYGYTTEKHRRYDDAVVAMDLVVDSLARLLDLPSKDVEVAVRLYPATPSLLLLGAADREPLAHRYV